MSEAGEIAINISVWITCVHLKTFDQSLALVRRVAPDLGSQMTDNVAEELLRRAALIRAQNAETFHASVRVH